ncbi:MAG: GNAT family N-acetyltransferase [Chloroflexota bacterium]
MLHQLEPHEYHKAADLLAKLAAYNVYITAVLNGDSPGRVYVDDRETPTAVFAISIDACYLAGDPANDAFNEALYEELDDTLFSGDRINPDDTQISVHLDSNAWEETLADLMEDWCWPPLVELHHHYICHTPPATPRPLPDGYTMARLDEALLQQQGERLPAAIANSIRIGWQNEANFLAHGFGFCALHGEEIACWCLADCVSAGAAEIGIETAADHRRRGLGTAVTQAALAHCFAQGMTRVGWHCPVDHTASIRTASNAGFLFEREYVRYVFLDDEARHFAELGRMYFFEAKLYAQAAEAFDFVFEIESEEPYPDHYYLLAARAWAHERNGRKALAYLNQAIDAGFRGATFLNSLPEFAHLRRTREWQEIVRRATA